MHLFLSTKALWFPCVIGRIEYALGEMIIIYKELIQQNIQKKILSTQATTHHIHIFIIRQLKLKETE